MPLPKLYVRGEMHTHYLKYYKLIRKFYARVNNLSEAELELLIYLDDMEFKQTDFDTGALLVTWDRNRFYRLVKSGWLRKFREYDPSKREGARWKTSPKTHQLVMRIYRVLAGVEEVPINHPLLKSDGYIDRRICKQLDIMRDEIRRREES